MKSNIRTQVCVCLLVLGIAQDGAECGNREWVRSAVAWYPPDYPRGPFSLQTVGVEGSRLIGTGAYYNHHSKDISIQIEGTVTKDNRFWPKVEAEVAMDQRGENWKAIPAVRYRGVPAVLPVSFEGPNVMLYFDLEVFRTFIGRERLGRVTLRSGESAVFRLADLLPTGSKREEATASKTSNCESIYGGSYQPEVKPPFGMICAESTSEHSVGLFGYAAPDDASKTFEIGETEDGKSWLSAECQVGNDLNGVWRLVGKAKAHGSRSKLTVESHGINTKLSIQLDILRPFVGRFRYGRVVVDEATNATFSLNELLPNTGEAISQ
jgi:hypothetical protein